MASPLIRHPNSSRDHDHHQDGHHLRAAGLAHFLHEQACRERPDGQDGYERGVGGEWRPDGRFISPCRADHVSQGHAGQYAHEDGCGWNCERLPCEEEPAGHEERAESGKEQGRHGVLPSERSTNKLIISYIICLVNIVNLTINCYTNRDECRADPYRIFEFL